MLPPQNVHDRFRRQEDGNGAAVRPIQRRQNLPTLTAPFLQPIPRS
jgi:hypothetical protein